MISTGQTMIGLTATPLDGSSTNPIRMTIQNLDSTDTIFIGGADVTITTGLGILKDGTLGVDLAPLQQLYAVSSKTGHRLSWLRQEV